jgi:predicted transcriptional regulator
VDEISGIRNGIIKMAGQTLTVRVESESDFHDRVEQSLDEFENGELEESRHELSLPSEAELARLFSETNIEILRAIAEHQPESMRATAKLVDRDIKDVSRNLNELESLGVIEFEQSGRSKRPIVWYDDIHVEIGLRPDSDDGQRMLA